MFRRNTFFFFSFGNYIFEHVARLSWQAGWFTAPSLPRLLAWSMSHTHQWCLSPPNKPVSATVHALLTRRCRNAIKHLNCLVHRNQLRFWLRPICIYSPGPPVWSFRLGLEFTWSAAGDKQQTELDGTGQNSRELSRKNTCAIELLWRRVVL